MSDSWTESVPFSAGSDGTPRPYLWLLLQGPNGGGTERILGLADSGADKTVLPLGYAELLGYRDEDLQDLQVGQVHGTTLGRDAQRPCRAAVFGHPEVSFEIFPIFVDTFDALWGRDDLMSAYRVSFSGQRQELGLHLPA